MTNKFGGGLKGRGANIRLPGSRPVRADHQGRQSKQRQVLNIESVCFGDMSFRFGLGIADRIGVVVMLGTAKRFYSLEDFFSFLKRLQEALACALEIENDAHLSGNS